MNYRTKSNAAIITMAIDDDSEDDVLVHVACAESNPETIHPYGGDYEFDDGECCAICGKELL